MKSTKIVATLGPASDSEDIIRKLHDSGMDVVRLNFSHGDHAYFKKVIRTVRKVNPDMAIMLDTKGPEIRTGECKEGITLDEGDRIRITNKGKECNKDRIVIRYAKLMNLKKGDMILLDDGTIELRVIDKKDGLLVEVIDGGTLYSRKTVSIRGHNIEIPFLSEKDKEDIMFGMHNDISFIAASFVRNVDDVRQLRRFIDKHDPKVKIISKIEHWEAVNNYKEIVDASDAVMVARGDLGVEVSLEKVPKIQTEIIHECNQKGKPVIVATQMLESMKDNPNPTRAEVGDVARAILEGTDAIMLSSETTIGKYPVRAVKTFAKIAKEYDSQVKHNVVEELDHKVDRNSIALFITRVIYMASKKLEVDAILTPTESGASARNVSRFKPSCPIFAITPDIMVMRQLQLSWGVKPMIETRRFKRTDFMVNDLVKKCHNAGYLKKGDMIAIAAGTRVSRSGHTNQVEVHYVDEILKGVARDET